MGVSMEYLHEEAVSFPDLNPPDGARLIAIDTGSTGEKYFYYELQEKGETIYLYESESGRRFKREMHEAEKRRKKRAGR